MPVSKPRKKRPSKVGAKPATPQISPLPQPQQVVEGLLADSARMLMQRVRLFEQLATDFPALDGLEDARLKLQVASLAIVDAVDAAAGRPMTYEAMREAQAG